MNGLLTRQTYGNEDYVEFTYDILGRAKTTTYKDENGNTDRVLTYVYTGDGQLYSIHDSKTGFLYLYTYDSIGRLIGSSVKNSDDEVLMSTRQEYNANNQLVGQHWTVGSITYSETYTYSTTDGALTSYNNALGQTINVEYDALRRLSKVDTTTLDRNYTYLDVSDSQTTGLVSSFYYTTANGGSTYYNYSYAYDALGNISSYTQSGTTFTYTYDDQNQLMTQTGGGKTYTYTYDNAGNILTASDGTTTNSYTYGNALWRDQLTAFNGQTITYDGSGNPLSYYNGKRYTFTWEEGRNLVSAVEGTNTYTYAYDQNGIRTSKTVNGVKHEYLYASGKLLRETIYDTNGNLTDTLDFVYDHNGHPFALRYTADGTTTNYYYITNLQGDVLYMITGSGTIVASYTYDPYGKVLTATGEIAKINPLRYRGYYYDAETEFYYLQSRYYDPIIKRFINSDLLAYIGSNNNVSSYNLFAYCANAPTTMMDVDGKEPISISLFLCYSLIYAIACVTVIAIITSPQFQQDWREMCNGAIQALDSGLQSLGGLLSSSIQELSTAERQITEAILLSFAALTAIPKYKSTHELHHVVAKRARNASYAREILDIVGIGYNSETNLIWLKTGLHRRLHTDLYYGWANSVIISAYHSAAGNPALQAANVLAAINLIKAFLATLNAKAPF